MIVAVWPTMMAGTTTLRIEHSERSESPPLARYRKEENPPGLATEWVLVILFSIP